MNHDIYKVGGILIQNRKLLVTCSKGKDFFVAPGGKIEGEERPFDALKRELKEELNIDIKEDCVSEFGTFYAKATGNESKHIRMDVYIINEWEGTPVASSEIEKLQWISSNDVSSIKVGSIFEHEVIPRLKSDNLID